MAVKIHRYTGAWQAPLRPQVPRVGTHVLLPASGAVDAREWDGFRNLLTRNALRLDFVRAKNSRWDTYKIVRGDDVDLPFAY